MSVGCGGGGMSYRSGAASPRRTSAAFCIYVLLGGQYGPIYQSPSARASWLLSAISAQSDPMSSSPSALRRPDSNGDQDSAKKRRRGAARLSCAECRRLKLKCDRSALLVYLHDQRLTSHWPRPSQQSPLRLVCEAWMCCDLPRRYVSFGSPRSHLAQQRAPHPPGSLTTGKGNRYVVLPPLL